MKSVYMETSIPSYLTARPSRDVRAAAWQEITVQWWDTARSRYDLYTSEIGASGFVGGFFIGSYGHAHFNRSFKRVV